MNILDKIVAHKKTEVLERKQHVSVQALEQRELFQRKVVSIKKSLTQENASGIIAEFKRKSPSKGIINATASVATTTSQYANAGASALSVLTDQDFFGGSDADFVAARNVNTCPMLRKDFVVDEYQIIEAKALGADAILLIAAVLEPEIIKQHVMLAHSLRLEVLLEVHDEEELKRNLNSNADLIGVNNRNLKTFAVSTDVSKRLSALIPSEIIKVSESGIDDVATILELKQFGYQGFLMGQRFMERENPGLACQNFIDQLKGSK